MKELQAVIDLSFPDKCLQPSNMQFYMKLYELRIKALILLFHPQQSLTRREMCSMAHTERLQYLNHVINA